MGMFKMPFKVGDKVTPTGYRKDDYITFGKTYEVLEISTSMVVFKDDNGDLRGWTPGNFTMVEASVNGAI